MHCVSFAYISVTYLILFPVIGEFEGGNIFALQIKGSGEARAREPYGSRGDDETECLTTLIKRHANVIVRKRNLTRGVQLYCLKQLALAAPVFKKRTSAWFF